MGEGPQVAFAHGYRSFDLIVLHVFPDPLVGVELRRVRRKEEEPEPVFGGQHVVLDDVRRMGRGAVDDEEHRGGAIVRSHAS